MIKWLDFYNISSIYKKNQKENFHAVFMKKVNFCKVFTNKMIQLNEKKKKFMLKTISSLV